MVMSHRYDEVVCFGKKSAVGEIEGLLTMVNIWPIEAPCV